MENIKGLNPDHTASSIVKAEERDNQNETKNEKFTSLLRKGKLVGLALLTFLASCKGPEAPSQQTIEDYFSQNSQAEKIDVEKIKDWFLATENFKKAVNKDKNFVLDLRVASKESAVYEAEMMNDSTILITQEFDGEDDLYPNRTFTFYKNGDIDLAIGQLDPNKKYKEVAVAGHVNGKTGGITAFRNSGLPHYRFKLNHDGEMKTNYYYREEGTSLKIAEQYFKVMEYDMINIKKELK